LSYRISNQYFTIENGWGQLSGTVRYKFLKETW